MRIRTNVKVCFAGLVALAAFMLLSPRAYGASNIKIGEDTDPTRTLTMDTEFESPDWEEVVIPLLRQREEQIQKQQREAEEARLAEEARQAEEARRAAEAKRVAEQAKQRIRASYGNSYSRGNCTWYVASRRPVPTGWGNARNWLSSARAMGWNTSSQPSVGSIAWTGAGALGHVAYVESIQGGMVLVSEMNFNGFNVISRRLAPASSFLYIN